MSQLDFIPSPSADLIYQFIDHIKPNPIHVRSMSQQPPKNNAVQTFSPRSSLAIRTIQQAEAKLSPRSTITSPHILNNTTQTPRNHISPHNNSNSHQQLTNIQLRLNNSNNNSNGIYQSNQITNHTSRIASSRPPSHQRKQSLARHSQQLITTSPSLLSPQQLDVLTTGRASEFDDTLHTPVNYKDTNTPWCGYMGNNTQYFQNDDSHCLPNIDLNNFKSSNSEHKHSGAKFNQNNTISNNTKFSSSQSQLCSPTNINNQDAFTQEKTIDTTSQWDNIYTIPPTTPKLTTTSTSTRLNNSSTHHRIPSSNRKTISNSIDNTKINVTKCQSNKNIVQDPTLLSSKNIKPRAVTSRNQTFITIVTSQDGDAIMNDYDDNHNPHEIQTENCDLNQLYHTTPPQSMCLSGSSHNSAGSSAARSRLSSSLQQHEQDVYGLLYKHENITGALPKHHIRVDNHNTKQKSLVCISTTSVAKLKLDTQGDGLAQNEDVNNDIIIPAPPSKSPSLHFHNEQYPGGITTMSNYPFGRTPQFPLPNIGRNQTNPNNPRRNTDTARSTNSVQTNSGGGGRSTDNNNNTPIGQSPMYANSDLTGDTSQAYTPNLNNSNRINDNNSNYNPFSAALLSPQNSYMPKHPPQSQLNSPALDTGRYTHTVTNTSPLPQYKRHSVLDKGYRSRLASPLSPQKSITSNSSQNIPTSNSTIVGSLPAPSFPQNVPIRRVSSPIFIPKQPQNQPRSPLLPPQQNQQQYQNLDSIQPVPLPPHLHSPQNRLSPPNQQYLETKPLHQDTSTNLSTNTTYSNHYSPFHPQASYQPSMYRGTPGMANQPIGHLLSPHRKTTQKLTSRTIVSPTRITLNPPAPRANWHNVPKFDYQFTNISPRQTNANSDFDMTGSDEIPNLPITSPHDTLSQTSQQSKSQQISNKSYGLLVSTPPQSPKSLVADESNVKINGIFSTIPNLNLDKSTDLMILQATSDQFDQTVIDDFNTTSTTIGPTTSSYQSTIQDNHNNITNSTFNTTFETTIKTIDNSFQSDNTSLNPSSLSNQSNQQPSSGNASNPVYADEKLNNTLLSETNSRKSLDYQAHTTERHAQFNKTMRRSLDDDIQHNRTATHPKLAQSRLSYQPPPSSHYYIDPTDNIRTVYRDRDRNYAPQQTVLHLAKELSPKIISDNKLDSDKTSAQTTTTSEQQQVRQLSPRSIDETETISPSPAHVLATTNLVTFLNQQHQYTPLQHSQLQPPYSLHTSYSTQRDINAQFRSQSNVYNASTSRNTQLSTYPHVVQRLDNVSNYVDHRYSTEDNLQSLYEILVHLKRCKIAAEKYNKTGEFSAIQKAFASTPLASSTCILSVFDMMTSVEGSGAVLPLLFNVINRPAQLPPNHSVADTLSQFDENFMNQNNLVDNRGTHSSTLAANIAHWEQSFLQQQPIIAPVISQLDQGIDMIDNLIQATSGYSPVVDITQELHPPSLNQLDSFNQLQDTSLHEVISIMPFSRSTSTPSAINSSSSFISARVLARTQGYTTNPHLNIHNNNNNNIGENNLNLPSQPVQQTNLLSTIQQRSRLIQGAMPTGFQAVGIPIELTQSAQQSINTPISFTSLTEIQSEINEIFHDTQLQHVFSQESSRQHDHSSPIGQTNDYYPPALDIPPLSSALQYRSNTSNHAKSVNNNRQALFHHTQPIPCDITSSLVNKPKHSHSERNPTTIPQTKHHYQRSKSTHYFIQDLIDDYYISILDWSQHNNIIALGLINTIKLFNMNFSHGNTSFKLPKISYPGMTSMSAELRSTQIHNKRSYYRQNSGRIVNHFSSKEDIGRTYDATYSSIIYEAPHRHFQRNINSVYQPKGFSASSAVEQQRKIEKTPFDMTSIAWCDENKLAAGTRNGNVFLFDIEAEQMVQVYLGQHQGRIGSLAFCANQAGGQANNPSSLQFQPTKSHFIYQSQLYQKPKPNHSDTKNIIGREKGVRKTLSAARTGGHYVGLDNSSGHQEGEDGEDINNQTINPFLNNTQKIDQPTQQQKKKISTISPHQHKQQTPLTYQQSMNLFASGGKDGKIHIYDTRLPNPIISITDQHQHEVVGLKWSYDGMKLASGSNDCYVGIWDVFGEKKRYKQHQAAIRSLAWSPFDPYLLVSGGGTQDKTLCLWDTRLQHHRDFDCFGTLDYNSHTTQPQTFQGSINSYSIANSTIDANHNPNSALIKQVSTGNQVCNLMWGKQYDEIIVALGYSQNLICFYSVPQLITNDIVGGDFYPESTDDLATIITPNITNANQSYAVDDIFPSDMSRYNNNLWSQQNANRNPRLGGNQQPSHTRHANNIHGFKSRPLHMVLSPDGDYIAAASGDKYLRVVQIAMKE